MTDESMPDVPTFHGLTDNQRMDIVAELYQVLQDQIIDQRNEVLASIDRGLDLDEDGLFTVVRENTTMTITILINGGAQGSAYPQPGSSIDFGKDE